MNDNLSDEVMSFLKESRHMPPLNEDDNSGDAVARIVTSMDQVQALYKCWAQTVAIYHQGLIDGGLPPEGAIVLARDANWAWLCSTNGFDGETPIPPSAWDS